MRSKCYLLTRNFSEKILKLNNNRKSKLVPMILKPIINDKKGNVNV